MATIIGKTAIQQRLEKFKEWKAAKRSGEPAIFTDSIYVGVHGEPGFKVVNRPRNPLLATAAFNFPMKGSEYQGKLAWVDSLKKLSTHFRNVQAAHDVVRLRHTGWYGDTENQESLSTGHVVQIPGKKRKEQWLAFVVADDGESVWIETNAIYESAHDAAQAADDAARIHAEAEDEYRRNEAERCAERAENAASEIDSEAKWALTLLSDAMANDQHASKLTTLALTLGVSDTDLRRMLAAFATLEKNWANVAIELDSNDFHE